MSRSKTNGFFTKADVQDIKNPAYIVNNKTKKVVEWNDEFKRLTNFRYSDIVNKDCDHLFSGIQKNNNKYWQICSGNCIIRTLEPGRAGVIRKLWINSKDYKDQPIKRNVDVYLFPFEENQEKFTLHILSDIGVVHSDSYFKVLSHPVQMGIDVLKDVVKDVIEDDVHRIQNPAYVVKEVTESNLNKTKIIVEELKKKDKSFEEKKVIANIGSGCVVDWNKEFEVLTNFTPEDIDWNPCEKLIGGLRKEGQEEICRENCPIRNQLDQVALVPIIRDFWINSKDRRGENIKRKTDVCIFPFRKGNNRFTLHILFDKGISYDEEYFSERGKNVISINS